MNLDSECSGERQQADSAKKRSLPRLAPEFYRGRAFVHWTLTIEDRATGWLNQRFQHAWELALLHACARYELICPAYVLMPDHVHLLWIGVAPESDQRVAIQFLRKHLKSSLLPAVWQKQAHDHLLRENERTTERLGTVAHYIFENPVRAGLVEKWIDYRFNGCCIPGYPEASPTIADYWLRFWRIYNHLSSQTPLAGARGYEYADPPDNVAASASEPILRQQAVLS